MNFKCLHQDWKIVKLGDVAEVLDPQPDHRTLPEVVNGVPYIGVNDFLVNGDIDINSCRKVSEDVHLKQQRDILINDGGIIFGKIGTIGFPRLLQKTNTQYTLSANVVLIRPKIDILFILNWLKSDNIARQIQQTLHTTSQPALGILKIRELTILIPPLPEQRKIAEILSTWDNAIETLEQLITAKRKLKQGLMQQLLTGKKRFEEFEDSKWRRIKLGDICQFIKDGTHGTHERIDNGVPMLSAVNITKSGQVCFDNISMIPEEDYKKIHARYDIEDNDVLLTVVGTLGRSAIVQNLPKFTVQRSVAIIRVNEVMIKSNYLYCVSNSLEFQDQLKQRANITAQAGVYLGELAKINVFLPPMIEQEKLASIFSNISSQILTLETQLTAYKLQKRGLMQQLLTGKKRVKIPAAITI